MFLLIGYFINLSLEYKKVRQNNGGLKDLPLTFDIPFFISAFLTVLTVCMLLPHLTGKRYWTCEDGGHDGNDAEVIDSTLPDSNVGCFIMGSLIYISFITMYSYFSLLAFCVWRYLKSPRKPLFGVKKRYYHVAMWTYILGTYMSMYIIYIINI